MNEAITIIIPGEPRAKGRGRIGMWQGRPVMFTPPETKQNEDNIRAFARNAMKGRPAFGCPVYVKVYIYKSIPESKSKTWKSAALAGKLFPTCKPDVDNYVKSALDALNEIVWLDDCLVTDLYARKRYSDTPHLKIIVTPLEAACSQDKASQIRYTEPDQLKLTI